MTSRAYVLTATATLGAIALVFAVVVQAIRLRPRITPESIAAIQPEMTYAEVEALMGCPPGIYHGGQPHSYLVFTDPDGGHRSHHERSEYWESSDLGVKVVFKPSEAGRRVDFVVRHFLLGGPDTFRSRLLRLRPW